MTAPNETNARIVLSRHTLATYEAGAIAEAEPVATAAMIRKEITILQAFAMAHPEKAITLGDLVRRWQALGDRLKERLN
ncbi:hypothetical protein ACFSX5_01130 [Devosia albogilva]|uniref:Uncharacterized protein n=1 Tax=Devosia albogilva TaxID=429726 RepID=A0ABW5QFS6_9HYPH